MFDSKAQAADKGRASQAAKQSTAFYRRTSPFHRRASWFPRDEEESRPNFKWHWYDNKGSYNGWFDWLPESMRVGYWSPIACVFLVGFYLSMYLYMPQPLRFEITKADDFWFKTDCAVCLWCVFVVARAWIKMGSIAGFFISYTGWSWTILATRAGLEAAAKIIEPSRPELAGNMAVWGSALRFPAAVAAFITFTIWNFALFPIIYYKANDTAEKRENFLKFNLSFFMTNIHILNLPLASVKIVYGSSVRLFTNSDLWVGYLVVAFYLALYLGIMDRVGLHFYPIFCIRSASCALSFGAVLYLYYFLMHQGNKLILHLNPELIAAA